MKKVLAILLCTVMVLSSANMVFAYDEPQKIYNVSLDLNRKSPFGTFDGWGTSICWWGHHLGENLTDEQLDSVVKALYDEETGLGLNIARYNIGGGDDPTHNHQREFDGRDMPGVLDAEGNWNLSNDAGQLKALGLAVKYGADILEAFSNSPPYFMTESGCSSGNHNSGENNLPDENFDEFAQFLAEAVLRIEKEYGIKFDTLEPFNESDTNYWGYEGWQEGCHFDVEDHSRLILMVREELNKRGLTHVGVAAADETNVWRTGENIKNVYTKEAVNTLSQVNTHSYSVGDYNHTKNAVLEAGKPLYMTEVDGDGSVGGEDSGSMGPALWFANKINEDLRGLEPNAWVMWQAAAMAYDGEHKDSGYWNIMSIDKETSELHLTKKYYAYKQFTSFIRPGDTLVKTDYSNIVSAINEEEGKVVFVITNTDSASKCYELNVKNLGMRVENAECYITTESYDCAKLDLGQLEDNTYSVETPSYSITTVVLKGSVGSKSLRLTEKNNTVTAFVGEELEFVVTDENGNEVQSQIKIETNCNCMPDYTFRGNTFVFNAPHGELKFYIEKDGMRAEYPMQIVGDGSKVRIIGSGSERALRVKGNGIVLADRTNDASQIWTIEEKSAVYTSGGKPVTYYLFRNEKNGEYLSIGDWLTTGEFEKGWILRKDKGLYQIKILTSSNMIDVYNHATDEGAMVGVYEHYYATANQLFYFELCEPESAVEVEYLYDAITLKGTPFGTKPWDGDVNVTFDKAWDGNKETFFHADRDAERTGCTGIDLGENHLPFNKVMVNSRPGFEYRGWGATLSGCDTIDGEYKIIHTFTEEDFTRGEEAFIEIPECNYRYVKYETPQGGYCNVGEISLIYEPYDIYAEVYNDEVHLSAGRQRDENELCGEVVIISYYDGETLKKVENKDIADCHMGVVCNLAETDCDVRIQLMGRDSVLLATFFIKKY